MQTGFQIADGLLLLDAIFYVLAVILRELMWNGRGVNRLRLLHLLKEAAKKVSHRLFPPLGFLA